MQQMKNNFLNKEVQIYPNDTNLKFGIVTDINSAGVTFLITKSDSKAYVTGTSHFIAFSNNLHFLLTE